MHRLKPEGFSLIELLVALAVAAVLASLAAPSFTSFLSDQRLTSTINPVSRAMTFARSEAIKSGERMTVCARASDSQCGTDWNQGALVFRDAVRVRDEIQADRDAGDEIVRVVKPHARADVKIYAVASSDRTAASAYTPNFIRYSPDGRPNWENGTLYVCDQRGASAAQALNISLSGSIRPVASTTDSVVKDVFGRDVTCN